MLTLMHKEMVHSKLQYPQHKRFTLEVKIQRMQRYFWGILTRLRPRLMSFGLYCKTVTNATSNQVVFLNSDSSLQSIVKFRINTLDNTFQYDCDGYNCSESGGTIINGSGSTSGSGAKITTSVKYIIVSLLIR
jgi:hypothetical protein